MRTYIDDTITAEVKSLNQRLAEVEKGGIRYRGVYGRSETYQRGDATTYAGSLFIALKDFPSGDPMTTPDWQLAVKAGRPGKDAR